MTSVPANETTFQEILMKFRTLFVLLAVVLSLAPSVAQADKTSDAKKTLQTLYDQEVAALLKKDVAGMTKNHAPQFVHTGQDKQKRTLEAQRARMKQFLPFMSNIKAHSKISKLALNGNQATVTTEDHVEVTLTNPQDKRTARMVTDSVEETLWQNTGGKWLRQKSRSVKSTMSIDGKPVPVPGSKQEKSS
jgi:hypothetical protein